MNSKINKKYLSRIKLSKKNKSRINKFRGGSNNKTKTNPNNSNSNSKKESLTIFYPDVVISDNIDLTNKNYQNQPEVIINNADKNKIYLVTMTDPDAPNGEGNSNNFVYTHWVYIQSKEIKMVYVPYSPPSPPGGTHRYQFNLYDITNKSANKSNNNASSSKVKMSANDLSGLRISKDELQLPDARKNYNNKLSSFLQLNFKNLFKIQYKVSSNNEKDTRIKELELKNKKLVKKQKKQNKLKQEELQEVIRKQRQNSEDKKLQPQLQQQQQQQFQQQQQQQQQFQQQQIQQLQEQQRNRPGFGTFFAADVLANILF